MVRHSNLCGLHSCAEARRSSHSLTCCASAGVEFEKRIVANERDNVKFNFLKSTDPYHKYYQLRVRDTALQHLPPHADLPLSNVQSTHLTLGSCAGRGV
jgi:Surp module